jgi:hypothetical protein
MGKRQQYSRRKSGPNSWWNTNNGMGFFIL